MIRAALAIVLVATACTGGTRATVPGAAAGAAEVRGDAMPPTILGLRATEEDVSAQLKEARDRAYVSSVRLWSLREERQLRAVLEIARFAPDADVERRGFRDDVVAGIGSSAAKRRLVGDDVVYVTSGNRQSIYAWFDPLHLVVLSVTTDYPAPRALLRAALDEVKP